jgi:hypothetical protein
LPCAYYFFQKKKIISVLFFLLLMFISQLVLYFVDYLLVLLNTICIYPAVCNTTYCTSSSPSTYIRVLEQTTFREIFQSVIACVPTGWSHLSDSSSIPISIYYGHMIALEGVATSEVRCTAKP